MVVQKVPVFVLLVIIPHFYTRVNDCSSFIVISFVLSFMVLPPVYTYFCIIHLSFAWLWTLYNQTILCVFFCDFFFFLHRDICKIIHVLACICLFSFLYSISLLIKVLQRDRVNRVCVSVHIQRGGDLSEAVVLRGYGDWQVWICNVGW